MIPFFKREVKPMQKYEDRTKTNEMGDSVRTLTVLKIRTGLDERQDQHPQLVYVECGVQWANGAISKTWIALHRLLSSDYKLLPEGRTFSSPLVEESFRRK